LLSFAPLPANPLIIGINEYDSDVSILDQLEQQKNKKDDENERSKAKKSARSRVAPERVFTLNRLKN